MKLPRVSLPDPDDVETTPEEDAAGEALVARLKAPAEALLAEGEAIEDIAAACMTVTTDVLAVMLTRGGRRSIPDRVVEGLADSFAGGLRAAFEAALTIRRPS